MNQAERDVMLRGAREDEIGSGRVCAREGCGADLDALRKRPHAVYCSGACRIAAHRMHQGASPEPPKAYRKRTRRRHAEIRVGYGRLVAALGEEQARALLTDRQREVLNARAGRP